MLLAAYLDLLERLVACTGDPTAVLEEVVRLFPIPSHTGCSAASQAAAMALELANNATLDAPSPRRLNLK